MRYVIFFGILRSAIWQFLTDVLGKTVRTNHQESTLTLEDVTDTFS